MSKEAKDKKGTPAKKSASPRQRLAAITVVLLFVAALILLYFQHIQTNREFLTQHNLRHLGTIATVMQERLDAFGEKLKNQLYSSAEDMLTLPDTIRNTFRVQTDTTSKGVSGREDLKRNTVLIRPGVIEYYLDRGDPLTPVRITTTIAKLLDLDDLTDGAFDVLLLTNRTGDTVYFNSAPARMRITAIDSVLVGGKGVLFDRISSNSNTVQILITGTRYELYVQVMGEHRVCGLIESERFEDSAKAIHVSYFVDLLLVLILMLLAVPLITLHFARFSERIRPVSVLINIGCIIIGTAFGTLLVADRVFTNYNADDLDQALLKTLSRQLNTRVDEEFSTVDTMLALLDKTIDSKRLDNQKYALFRDTLDLPIRNILQKYPYFEQLYWLDSHGKMMAHWTTGTQLFDHVPLGDREYYTKIDDGKAHWIFPHYTRATGNFMVAYSRRAQVQFRFRTPDIRNNTSTAVGAVDFLPRSLYDTWMPEGYGYMIIDKRGNVLFHSITRRALHENLFIESPNADLRELLQSGLSGLITARYWDDNVRMYVAPLTMTSAEQQWYTVVYSEQDMLTDMKSGTTTMTAMFYLFFLIPLISGFVVYSLVWDRRMTLLWFRQGDGDWYRRRVWLLLFIGILTLVTALQADNMFVALFLGLIVPHAFFQITFWKLDTRVRQSGTSPEYRKKTAFRHTVAFFTHTFLLLVAVIVMTGSISMEAAGTPWFTLPVWIIHLYIIVFVVDLLKGWKQEAVNRWGKNLRPEKVRKWYARWFAPEKPYDRGFAHRWYVLLLTTVVVLIGFIPLLIFFRVSYDLHGNSYLRIQRQNLVHHLVQRERDFVQRFDSTFIISDAASSEAASKREKQSIPRLAELDQRDIYRYSEASVPAHDASEESLIPLMDDALLRLLMPPVNSNAKRFRRYIAADLTAADALHFKDADSLTALLRSQLVAPRDFHAVAGYDGLLPAMIGFLLVLISLYLVIRYGTARIFHAEMTVIPPEASVWTQCSHLFIWITGEMRDAIIRYYNRKYPNLRPYCINETDIEEFMKKDFVEYDDGKPLMLTCFEHRYHDSEFNLLKLELLEHLLISRGLRVCVVCSVDPVYYFFKSDATEKKEQLKERWARVLNMLVRIDRYKKRRPEEGCDSSGYPDYCSDLLTLARCECALPGMETVFEQLSRHIKNNILTDTEEVLAWIGRNCKPLYQNVWMTCSKRQRLILYRLAHDGFVPFTAQSILRELCERNIIHLSPALSICNESFRRFLLDVKTPAQIQAWQDEEPEGLWSNIKHPLLVGFAIIAAALFYANPSLYSSLVGILGALTAAVPIVLRARKFFTETKPD